MNAVGAADRRKTTKRRARTGGSGVAGPVQSLNRALRMLVRLSEHSDGVTLSDIAQQVGLAPSTAHRLLTTLELSGFAEQDNETGQWRVGVTAFTVGNAFLANRDIVAQSRSAARALMESSGETVNVAVLQGEEGVIIAQAECREMMRMVVPLGSRVPLHASGVGKALLSAQARDRVDEILHSTGLSRFTEHTIDRPAVLHSALAEIREQGFALDREEHAVGLHCVAAAIFDQHGEAAAAISVSGPKSRIPESRLMELGAQVRDAAREITRRFGGAGSAE